MLSPEHPVGTLLIVVGLVGGPADGLTMAIPLPSVQSLVSRHVSSLLLKVNDELYRATVDGPLFSPLLFRHEGPGSIPDDVHQVHVMVPPPPKPDR